MNEFTPVDAAWRELIERGHDRNLLVEASAGSGKTEALARRMAHGLATGAYQVERLAAVTFTRQAASELRGRLQLRLEDRLAGADPEEEERIRRALARLEHLFAGTIHAFCARLLRERPVEAGLTPGFRELEEGEDRALALQSFRRHLDSLRGQEATRFLRDLNLNPVELEGTFLKLCDYPDVEFPAEDLPFPDPEPARQAILRFRPRLQEMTPFNPASKCPLQGRIRTFLARTHIVHRNLGKLASALGELEREVRYTANGWGPGFKEGKLRAEEAKTLVDEFRREVALPFLEAFRAAAYAPLVRLLLGARQAYARDREAAGLLNYADLLLRAASVLRARPEVREALGRKYRWILVDEFQDTDPVQAEVLMWLASEPGDWPDWSRVRLRPGALFVVGDPKQSIYRFRRADISTYQTVRGMLGQVVPLVQSFRSRPEVCEWANRVFQSLLPADLTDTQAPFAPLVPRPAEPAPGEVGVRVLSTWCEKTYAKDVARQDAASVAAWIAGEVRRGRRRPGDFLVLTRYRPRIPEYVKALGRHGLPVEATYAGGPADSAPRRAVLDLLSALVDPEDPIRVVAALRGAFFGVSDEELHLHLVEGGNFRPRRGDDPQGPPRPSGHPSVVEALARLHRMVRWTVERTPAAAVEAVLEETGALAWAAAETVGGGEAGHLLDLVDRVRQAVEQGGSLAEAVQDLVEEVEQGPRDRPPRPLEAGRRDVVRVMNLHVAKGLEAPVVILADPAASFVFAPDLRVVRQGSKALGYLEMVHVQGWARRVLARPRDWAEHLAEEQRFCDAEAIRLLYVAATRARHLLVLTRVVAQNPPTYAWAPLGRFLGGVAELEVPRLDAPETTAPPVDPAPDAGERESRRESVLQPGWSRQAVTAAAEEDREVVLRLLERPTSSLGVDGAAWGSLVHRLLEQAVRGPRRSREHLERLARWFVFETPELADLVPQAVDTVLRVLDSDFGRHVLASERLVEVPFAVRRPDGVLLFGVLDLAVHAPEGWEIVDYKTDHRRVADLVALYGRQVQEYARTWEGLTGERVAWSGLYGVVEGELSPHCGEGG